MKIPKNFKIPEYHEFYILNDLIKVSITPLNSTFAKEDFSTIINNKKHLKGLFGELDDWWPSDSITEADNFKMLLWHEEEFKKRNSFAYIIRLNGEYSGCLYFYGLDEVFKIVSIKDYNIIYVFMWTTEEVFSKGFDKLIFDHLKKWISNTWDFTCADYPGRTSPLSSFCSATASWIKTKKE